ncbi:hypothetical protein HUJ05_012108 [Dendroctonus ponderosae]|nr:hypothetical protein HUJ05_012108 [Dendroctonus ponderosae]
MFIVKAIDKDEKAGPVSLSALLSSVLRVPAPPGALASTILEIWRQRVSTSDAHRQSAMLGDISISTDFSYTVRFQLAQ